MDLNLGQNPFFASIHSPFERPGLPPGLLYCIERNHLRFLRILANVCARRACLLVLTLARLPFRNTFLAYAEVDIPARLALARNAPFFNFAF